MIKKVINRKFINEIILFFSKKKNPIFAFLLFNFFLTSFSALSQTVTIPQGSLIIDMGVVPQTVEKALKPYELVYELINVRKAPVLWSINPSKSKDGIDY